MLLSTYVKQVLMDPLYSYLQPLSLEATDGNTWYFASTHTGSELVGVARSVSIMGQGL